MSSGRWYRNPKNKKEWLHGIPKMDIEQEIEDLKYRVQVLEEKA